MNRSIVVSSLVGAMLVAGCAPCPPTQRPAAAVPAADATPVVPTPNEAEAAPPNVPGGLAAVLDVDNIGRRLDIFERRVGPPDDAGEHWTRYTVEHCDVRAVTEGGTIRWIDVTFRDGCRIDLAPILGTSRIVGDDKPMTFGDFDESVSGQTNYTFPCEGVDCANAFDPYVLVVAPGGHAGNYIDVEARSNLRGEHDYDIYRSWKEKLTAASRKEFFDADLDCVRLYDTISRRTLGSLTIDSIAFGHRENRKSCR